MRTGKGSRGRGASPGNDAASASTRRPARRQPPAVLEPRHLNGLTQRDEIQLRLLLDADDDLEPEPFGGLGEADRHRLAEIDRQLAAFQASDPLFASRSSLRPPDGVQLAYDVAGGGDATDHDDHDDSVAGGAGTATGTAAADGVGGHKAAPKGDPVVAAQRAHRAHRRYVEGLERRLMACRANDFDYSGLILADGGGDGDGDDDDATGSTSPTARARRGYLDTAADVDVVDLSPSGERKSGGALARAVSMQDIRRVLSTLKGSLGLQVGLMSEAGLVCERVRPLIY